VDSDDQADEAWLLSVQHKLYQWSRKNPDSCYRELWNWVTDLRNLRCAWRRIASNKGSRTAGIDGITVASIRGVGLKPFSRGFGTTCGRAGIGRARVVGSGFPSRVNQGSSDPWGLPP
jgi:hypothetical protein